MHDDARLTTVLPTLPRIAVHGPWSRAIAYRLTLTSPPGAPAGSPPQPLWPGGARMNGGRFTPKGSFDSLYLANNPLTALEETTAVFMTPDGGIITHLHEPFVVLSVDGIVADVLDLTDAAVQKAISTNDTELRGPWVRAQTRFAAGSAPMPPTQCLGSVASASGVIAGLRYPSAKDGGGENLIVLTDRLGLNAANQLRVHDPSGHMKQTMP